MNANDANDDEGRIEALRSLSLAREPARDLWPGIAARLASRRRRPVWPWLGALAASGLVAAVVLQTWMPSQPRTQPATQGLVAAVEPLPERRRVMPQQQALLKANLAIVKDAESQLRHALEQDPDSAALRRLLDSMQQRRGDLGQRLAQET
jgi:hypothetical protein